MFAIHSFKSQSSRDYEAGGEVSMMELPEPYRGAERRAMD